MLLGAAVLAAIVWRHTPGLIFGTLVLIHYATTTARVRWLVAQHPTG